MPTPKEHLAIIDLIAKNREYATDVFSKENTIERGYINALLSLQEIHYDVETNIYLNILLAQRQQEILQAEKEIGEIINVE